jgi:hypothetical protein
MQQKGCPLDAAAFCLISNFLSDENLHLRRNYSSEIVPTGHEPAHAPHEMHIELSITNVPPLSLIAPTGHEPAHEPQPIHESPITKAISVSSL